MSALLLMALPVSAKLIVDQAGRRVTLPDRITRVYASSPPLVMMLNVLSPERMVGLNFPFEEAGKHYVTPHVAGLPVVGGVFGVSSTMNIESIMRLKPDFVLAWNDSLTQRVRLEESFARAGIPVVFVNVNRLGDWPSALTFVGRVLGEEKRAQRQANYVRRAMRDVAAAVGHLPDAQKVRVYYAEKPDGLATDCHQSFHTEAIELAGGYNVYRCQAKDVMGMEPISIEQVIAFDPQVILIQDAQFIERIKTDPRWRAVRAVREGRVYVIPRWPYNWIDRPPSGMKAIGIQWLAHVLYPQRFRRDMTKETKRFFRLFYGLDLNPNMVEGVLSVRTP